MGVNSGELNVKRIRFWVGFSEGLGIEKYVEVWVFGAWTIQGAN